MVNLTKWAAVVASLSSLVIIVLPAVSRVPHTQALLNLLLGEIAAIALAHSAYRISSGKQASPVGVLTGLVCGLVLLVSPLLFAPVDPFLTLMVAFSLVVVVGAVAAGVERIRGGEEGRQTGAQRIAGSS